jgi:hypothetical protein
MRDRLLRTGARSFVLMVAGELPDDPEVELSYNLEEVFDWYRDCPFQIERASATRAFKMSVSCSEMRRANNLV